MRLYVRSAQHGLHVRPARPDVQAHEAKRVLSQTDVQAHEAKRVLSRTDAQTRTRMTVRTSNSKLSGSES